MGVPETAPPANQLRNFSVQDGPLDSPPAQAEQSQLIGRGTAGGADSAWLSPVAPESGPADSRRLALAGVVAKFAKDGISALTPDEFASLVSFAEQALKDPDSILSQLQTDKRSLVLSLAFTLAAQLKGATVSGEVATYLAERGLTGDSAVRNWERAVSDLPKPPVINEPDLGRIVRVNQQRLAGIALPFARAEEPVPAAFFVGGSQVVATNAERQALENEIVLGLGEGFIFSPGINVPMLQPHLPPIDEASEVVEAPILFDPLLAVKTDIEFYGDTDQFLREHQLTQAYVEIYQIYGELGVDWPEDLRNLGEGTLKIFELPALLDRAYSHLALQYQRAGVPAPFSLPSMERQDDPAVWKQLNTAIDPVAFKAISHDPASGPYLLSPSPDDEFIMMTVPGYGEVRVLEATKNKALARTLIEQRGRIAMLEANIELSQSILSRLPPANWFQEYMAGVPPSLGELQHSLKAARVALAQGDLPAYYREVLHFEAARTEFNANIQQFISALAEADQDVQQFVTGIGNLSLAILVVASVIGSGGFGTPAAVTVAGRVALALPIASVVGGEYAHSALTGEKVDISRFPLAVALTIVAVRAGPVANALMKRLIAVPGASQLELSVLQQIATNLAMGVGFRGAIGLESAVRDAQAEAAGQGPLTIAEISELVASHILLSVGDPKALTIDVLLGAVGGVAEARYLNGLTATRGQALTSTAKPVPDSLAPTAAEKPEFVSPKGDGAPAWLRSGAENDNAIPWGGPASPKTVPDAHPRVLRATGTDDVVVGHEQPSLRALPDEGSAAGAADDLVPVASAGSRGGNGDGNGPGVPPLSRRHGPIVPPPLNAPTASSMGGAPPRASARVQVNAESARTKVQEAREALARLAARSDAPPAAPAGSPHEGNTVPSPAPNASEWAAVLNQLEHAEEVLRQVVAARVTRPGSSGGSTMPSPAAPGVGDTLTATQALLAQTRKSLANVIPEQPLTAQPAAPQSKSGSTVPFPALPQQPVDLKSIIAQLERVQGHLGRLVSPGTVPAQPRVASPPAASVQPSATETLGEIASRMSGASHRMAALAGRLRGSAAGSADASHATASIADGLAATRTHLEDIQVKLALLARQARSSGGASTPPPTVPVPGSSQRHLDAVPARGSPPLEESGKVLIYDTEPAPPPASDTKPAPPPDFADNPYGKMHRDIDSLDARIQQLQRSENRATRASAQEMSEIAREMERIKVRMETLRGRDGSE